MAPSNGSHAEIWDDSALVNSWNDALEEYKVRLDSRTKRSKADITQKYHSIKARGEDPEEVLGAAGNLSNGVLVQKSKHR